MPRLASGGRRGGAARAVDALAPCVTGRDFLRCAHVAPPGQEHSELSQDGAESTGADEERGAYRHVEDCDGPRPARTLRAPPRRHIGKAHLPTPVTLQVSMPSSSLKKKLAAQHA